MADYYSLLARAVANLPKPAPPGARQAIYDRARKALNNQLRALKPPLPESDIAREETALEAAVLRLEDEHGSAPAAQPGALARVAPAAHRPPPIARPAPPRPLTPVEPIARPAAPPPIRPAAPSPRSAAPPDRAMTTVARPLGSPRPSVRPPLSTRTVATPQIGGSNELVGGIVADLPSAYATISDEESTGRLAPPVAAELPPPARPDPNASRPSAPRAEESAGGRAWLWVTLALLVGLIGAIAVAAFLLRSQKPQDLALKESPAASAPSVADGPKIENRAGGQSAVTRAPPPPASPPPSSAPSPAPPSAPDGSMPAASPPAAAAPNANPSTTAATAEIAPASARAAMLVAAPQDTQKPVVNVGAVTWSLVPPNPNQTNGPGVKADIQIPELKMHASMILRRNVDSSLPASHTIDLRITFDDGSSITGVKDIGVPQMRRDDPPQVIPLAGVRVKINETYFLIGLNRGDTEIQRNLDAIAQAGWFDFPMLLNDGRIAKLTFEKANEGEKIVSAALEAWK